jgi:hypothetical protein
VVDPDQPGHLHRSADLLHAFARRRLPWVLVIVDESARKAPQAAARFNGAATQHDATVDLDYHCCRDLGVMPEDEVVLRTCLDLSPLDDTDRELGAAEHAVVTH